MGAISKSWPFCTKKQAIKNETEDRLYDLTKHINKLNTVLNLRTVDCQKGEELSVVFERINDQLTLIEDTLLLGEYSPRGKIQDEINKFEKEQAVLQENISQMGETIDQMHEKSEKMSAEIKTLRSTEAEQKQSIKDLNVQLKEAADNEQKILLQSEQIKASHKQSQDALKNVLVQMISYRDQLFAQLDYAKTEHDAKAIKIIKGMLMILKSVFEDAGIVILDQAGKYDSAKQYISRTIPTDNIEQDMQIKETTKEGYLFGEKIIRQQEVAVYHYKQNKV